MDKARYPTEVVRAVVRDAFRICKSQGLKAALIGGVAVDAWGHARATFDVDVLADFKPENIGRIKAAALRAGGSLDRQWEEGSPRETRMVRFRLHGVQVDLIRPLFPWVRRALESRVRRSCYGISTWIIQLEDLIISKLQLSRPRDIDDAVALCVSHPRIIKSLSLKKQLRKLGLGREWEFLCGQVSRQLSDPLG